MELIESGLAGMEIPMGECRIKTKVMSRKERSNYLRSIREEQEMMRRQQEEKLLRYPQLPPCYEYEEEVFEEQPTEEQEIEGYRKFWERSYGHRYGSFDAETSLGPMYCTTGTIAQDAFPESSLQIFSIKITNLSYALGGWPLQVYGFVAARDSVDRKRNYLFRCTRDNCQTLDRLDPFLRLTGPSRAILLIDPVVIEVQLRVKGTTESDDEVLAFGCLFFHEMYPLEDGICALYPRNNCTLELALAVLSMSVEATLGVRVVDGSWPDQCSGRLVCNTGNVKEGKVVLLDFRNGKMPTKSDGAIELLRNVVSVDYPAGTLIVSVEASRSGFSAQGTVDLAMQVSGRSTHTCDLVFCKMEVTVSWSLVSAYRGLPAKLTC